MKDGRVFAVVERISRFPAQRRLRSFIITAALILLTADAIRQGLAGERDMNPLTWIALALMAYAVILLVVLPKRVAPSVRLVVAWGLAYSPAVFGFAAALADSPVLVMWFGVLLSLCLVSWVAIVEAPRATKRLPNDSR